ncbi:MAG: ABC transporter permease [Candidatus Humimicrobiaceae bacterium]
MGFKEGTSGTFKKIGRIQEIGVITALVALYLILGFSTKHFFDFNNLISILRASSYVGIMSLGMVFVISEREIDLSVGGIYNLTGLVTALMLVKGLPILLAILVGILIGMACGLLNFGLSYAFKIPMIIITLGTMSVYKGFGLVISQASPIYKFSRDTWFVKVVGVTLFGKIPTGVVVLLVLTAVLALVYGFTIFGTRVRAIGSNPEAAKFSGININKYRAMVFALMGALCAVASTLEVAFLQAGNPSMGGGIEMMVIAAAIIGGTSLAGGQGSVIGALIGAVIISVIRNGIVQLGVDIYWSATVTGFVIIAAVAVDYLFKRRKLSS